MLQSLRGKVPSIALGLVVAASAIVGTAKADVRDFEFVNLNGSASIVGAWFAPAGDSDEPWTRIALYVPIGPRSTAPINVTGGTRCLYDLKVQLSYGEPRYFYNVNLCSAQHLIVT
jgi:hypothetical protein